MARNDLMAEAVAFANDFIAKEFQALKAKYTLRNEEMVRQAIAQFEALVEANVEIDMARPVQPGEGWFEAGEAMLATGRLAPRILFQIKVYAHPRYGTLVRLYMSAPSISKSGQTRYFSNYYATQFSSGLKVNARYDIDLLPDQPGQRLQDGNLSWIYAGGIKLFELGRLIAVKKFQEPGQPEHLAEYLSE